MTIPLILTTGFRHWLFSIFLEKAFLHRRLQCSSHYRKSEKLKIRRRATR
jgi:hypothetical protein